MGKASSAKKVARAARAGGTRRPGQRRALGFPVMMTAILVLGVALVAFARSSREANAAPISQASDPVNYDHWHAAVGFYQCDHFIFDGTDTGGAALTDGAAGDTLGIHTHGDGIIHIHPFQDSAGGRNARLALWFQDVGLTVTDSTVTFPDGVTVWDEATTKCGEGDDAKSGQIVIAKWDDAQAAADGDAPSDLFYDGFDRIRFQNDREAYTIAYLPTDFSGTVPVRPGIMDTLNNLSDVGTTATTTAPTDSTGSTGSTGSTTGGTDTTLPGETTTTGAGSATTTATTAGATTTSAG